MNPETGFAPEMEMNEAETPEPRHLADILHLSVEKIREMSGKDLQRLHDEMVPLLGRPDKPSSGFSGYVEHLPEPLQKKMKKPGVAEEYLRTYLETGLTTLRSRVRIDEAEHLRQEWQEKNEARDRASREFLQATEEQVERMFIAWSADREIIDRHGQPGKLYPEDKAFVEKIDNNRKIERAKLEEFFDLTDRYEVGLVAGMERYQTFGADAETTFHPSSKFDDYARGLDMVARIRPYGNENEIVLGIDFTITSSDIDIAKKLRRNRQNPLRQTKYATRAVPRGLEYFPVVISVDQQRAERTVLHEAKIQTMKTHPGGEAVMEQSTEEVAYHHDEAIFQHTLIHEIVSQLHVQREELEDRDANEATLARYAEAIEYFEGLLVTRKNLQAIAGLEMRQDEAVYRVANESFIRSVPELVAGVGASRAA